MVSIWTSTGASAPRASTTSDDGGLGSVEEVHVPGETLRDDTAVGFPWVIRLRWGAVAAQALMAAVAFGGLHSSLPWWVVGGLMALTVGTNVVLSWTKPERRGPGLTAAIVVFDAVLLTVLLQVSGGAQNPLSVFFVVHVALAAHLLAPALAWGMVALTTLLYGSLFVFPVSAHCLAQGRIVREDSAWGLDDGRWHFLGMWACYALAACFVCYFISKVAEAIRVRDARLAEARGWMAQNERLSALSSFSANAAHELGTPLATIRLVAKELVRALEKRGGDDALRADAALIHAEVERCRRILSDLAAKAGDSVGEAPVATTPSQVLEESLRLALGARPMAVRVSYGNDAWAEAPVVVPAKTLAQMIANLLRNAVDAQAAERSEEPVELHVAVDDDWRVVVRDRGPGLSPSLRTRLGKPFVTTKRDGGGLGLGVYLVSTFAERCGGSLRFAPREGGGLEAILSLPRNALKGAS